MTKQKVSFSWDVHWACNYRCPYCWWHGRWEDLKKRNRYPGTKALATIWKRIYDRYGEVNIAMLGGEPLTYPDLIPFMGSLLDYHTVGITTNLSVDVAPLLNILSGCKASRLSISATFHPLFADLNSFMAGIRKIKEKGMNTAVLYLAYPPQVGDIPRYKKVFSDADISFSVLTFWGKYNEREYPQSYSPEEIKIINEAIGKREGENFQLQPILTRGKLCNAGHRYGIIHPDGDVYRCGGGGVHGRNIKIGNIFDDNFELFKEPQVCHSDHCPCNEWAFLLTERNSS